MEAMVRRWIRLVVVLIAAGLFQVETAHAQESCVGKFSEAEMTAERRQIWNLLRERQFDKLDAELLDRQQRYEHGTYTEEHLVNAFSTFDSSSNSIRPFLEEWLRTHKDSYAAHVAMGSHQVAVAMELRGHKIGGETSDDQFKEMIAWMRKAESTLTESFSLTAKPIMTYVLALQVERYMGTRDSIDELYQRALEVDPNSAYARRYYLWGIDPRWLGEPDDLAKEIERVRASGLPDDTKHFVIYHGFILLAGANTLFKKPDQVERALLAASRECVFTRPWEDLANLYDEQQQWKQALGALDKYLALKPDEAWAIRRQAYAHQKLGEWSVAIPLYKTAAEKGDDYAQNAYGWWLYRGEHTPRDLEAAIKWFELAAKQGNETARVNLAEALRARTAEKAGAS